MPGTLSAEAFLEAASNLPRKPKMTRFFVSDEDLVRIDGYTCSISNQWAIKDVPAFEQIAKTYPKLRMHIKKAGM